MSSSRRPYHRPVPRDWWLRQAVYRRYMLREATSLFVGAYAFFMLQGLYCLRQGEAAWQDWLAGWQHPLWVVFSLVCLGMALFHTVTWFAVTPKAIPLQFGTFRVPPSWIIGGHYAGAVVASVGVLLLAGGFF